MKKLERSEMKKLLGGFKAVGGIADCLTKPPNATSCDCLTTNDTGWCRYAGGNPTAGTECYCLSTSAPNCYVNGASAGCSVSAS